MPLALDFAKKPGPGVGPIVVGGARGDAEDFGRFLEGHADEVAQLDQFRFGLALLCEFVERVIHGEQLVVVARGGKFRRLKINALLPASMTQRALAAGVVNQDAAHRLGCRGEEMSAICELRVFLAHQAHPGLMNQCRGLECLTGGFVRHPVRRQFAQLLIDQRKQFVRGVGIALLDGGQDLGNVADA
jgi:hypothetical protein